MPGNDLFAPPSPDELKLANQPSTNDLFAPPSQDELSIGKKPSVLQGVYDTGKEYAKKGLGILGGLQNNPLSRTLDTVFDTQGARERGNKLVANTLQKGGFSPEEAQKKAARQGELSESAMATVGNLSPGKLAAPRALVAAEEAAPALARPAMNIDEIGGVVSRAEKAGKLSNAPTIARLKEVEKIIPDLEFPATNLHKGLLETKQGKDILSAMKELPEESAVKLQKYDQLMKNEGIGKLEQTLSQDRPRLSLPEASEDLGNKFKESYESTKGQLGPIFEEYKSVPLEPNHQVNLQDTVMKKLGLGENQVVATKGGGLKLAPHDPGMKFSEEAHGAINKTLDYVTQPGRSIGELQNAREYLRSKINPQNAKDASYIGKVRSAILDHIEDQITKANPEANVKDTFKNYAVNESNLDAFEKVMGSPVDQVNPDSIKRVFSNQGKMRELRKIIPEPEFQSYARDFVNSLKDAATDNVSGFSSQKFASALKKFEPQLKEALPKAEFDRISALTDHMRIIPDMPSSNPSGTAKQVGFLSAIKHPVAATAGLLKSHLDKRSAVNTVNTAMGTPLGPRGPGLIGQKSLAGAAALSAGAGDELNRRRNR